MTRILADENASHRLIAACKRIRPGFPIVHIADWQDGACLCLQDPALLMTLRDRQMILVSFDRASMAMYAGTLTRQGVGHAGIVLFRRSVSPIAYGFQARLLVELMDRADKESWDWADRIEYLPRQ
jgi:hypothetical protein